MIIACKITCSPNIYIYIYIYIIIASVGKLHFGNEYVISGVTILITFLK